MREGNTAMHEDCYVSVGDVIAGKYLVENVLGVGGMAFVVAARHIELDERFALKFLAPRLAMRPEVVERFTREAKAACRIRSEHVARVHDVGMHELGPFLVMEHLSGRDLATVLSECGPLPVEVAVEHVMQVCEALAAAHALGIIHRDIKPENLFRVEADDAIPMIKLLDFGISKVMLARDAKAKRLTGDLAMGTPNYMSPEQIRSTASADARSDQWSLGVVLYELLSGLPPFEADTTTELCAAVLESQARPLRELSPAVPPGLAAVIARCMEKNPALRFPDIADLAEALLPFGPSRALVSVERSTSAVASSRRESGRHVLSLSTPTPMTVIPVSEVPVVAEALPPVRVESGPRKNRVVQFVVAACGIAAVASFALHRAPSFAPAVASAPPPIVTAEPAPTHVEPPVITAATMRPSEVAPTKIVPVAATTPPAIGVAVKHAPEIASVRKPGAKPGPSAQGSASSGVGGAESARAPAAAPSRVELGY